MQVGGRTIKFGLLIMLGLTSPTLADALHLNGDSSVRFATAQEGAVVLSTPDRFVTALSPFDRQSRLGSAEDVSQETFLGFIGDQAVAWDPVEMQKISDLIQSIRSRVAGYSLSLPSEVVLVRTTGQEEAQAAHCRRNAIVLPPPVVARPNDKLEVLLVHELFHILSSHNPEMRKRLYEIIGFHVCAPIDLPAQLQDRKITNPDGPLIDAYVEVMVDDRKRPAVPVLFASKAFDPQQNANFFDYLTFRLMLITRLGDQPTPILDDGQPILLDPRNLASFHQQIGRNTKYILHPDEVLADNFVHLVFQTPDLPTPRIVAEMKQQLLR